MVFWPGRAINFRGSAQEWPDFVAGVMRDRYVTDLVLFGDCRPYHRVALKVARHAGAIAHIFEEGYIRPNWITLEHGGTNGNSSIPRDPNTIRALADELPEPPSPVQLHASFFTRSMWDVTANVLGALLWPLFPHYRWHGTEHPLLEYFGWIRRFAHGPESSRHARKTIARVVDAGLPYFLVPLQLHSDYQIRSPFSLFQRDPGNRGDHLIVRRPCGRRSPPAVQAAPARQQPVRLSRQDRASRPPVRRHRQGACDRRQRPHKAI